MRIVISIYIGITVTFFFFSQIISLNTSPAMIVVNVPDILATVIPPALLVFPQGTADLNVLNKKIWTPEQVSYLFQLFRTVHTS